MRLLPKSIHRCRRYPTKFNSGRDIPLFCKPDLAVEILVLEIWNRLETVSIEFQPNPAHNVPAPTFGSKPKQEGADRPVWWRYSLFELTADVFQFCVNSFCHLAYKCSASTIKCWSAGPNPFAC